MSRRRSVSMNDADLAATIEGEIVPRLLMLRATFGRPPRWIAPSFPAPDVADVAELARLLLRHDEAVAGAFVRIIANLGVPLDRIYLDLLAPTARRLGELCENDECGLDEFTAGMGRLETLVRTLSGSPR